MSVRLTLVLSDDLIQAIDRAAEDDASSRAEVFAAGFDDVPLCRCLADRTAVPTKPPARRP